MRRSANAQHSAVSTVSHGRNTLRLGIARSAAGWQVTTSRGTIGAGDVVIAGTAEDPIFTVAGRDVIVTIFAIEDVVARAALHGVVARPAGLLGAVGIGQRVIAGAAAHEIATDTAVEGVISGAADQRVASVSTMQLVIAVTATQHIGAVAARSAVAGERSAEAQSTSWPAGGT